MIKSENIWRQRSVVRFSNIKYLDTTLTFYVYFTIKTLKPTL